MKSPNRGFLTKSAYSSTELVKFHRCEGSNPSSPTEGDGRPVCYETAPRSPSLYLPGDDPPEPPVSAAPTGAGVPATAAAPTGGVGFRGRRTVAHKSTGSPHLHLRPRPTRRWLPHPHLTTPGCSRYRGFLLCVLAGGVAAPPGGGWGGRRSMLPFWIIVADAERGRASPRGGVLASCRAGRPGVPWGGAAFRGACGFSAWGRAAQAAEFDFSEFQHPGRGPRAGRPGLITDEGLGW